MFKFKKINSLPAVSAIKYSYSLRAIIRYSEPITIRFSHDPTTLYIEMWLITL